MNDFLSYLAVFLMCLIVIWRYIIFLYLMGKLFYTRR